MFLRPRRLPVFITAATFALASSVAAFEPDNMSDAERDAFRAEIRAYLLDNPEVLMEAIGVLEAREQEAQLSQDATMAQSYASALFEDGYSWVGGNPEGDITMVEFIDYRCGYCRQAFEEVGTLVEGDGNIRFIIKEFPILGEQSMLASQFAIATQQLHDADAYKQVHDALMTIRGDITPDSLTRLAETLDLDPEPLLAHMESPQVASVIAENRLLAQQMNISGTPTFVVEDQMLRGYVPLAQMEAIVADIRAN